MSALNVVPDPTTYPMSMARYGLNPHGEPVYRVVFAPSVKKLVGGKFADGFIGYRVRKSYPHLGACWALEKWLSPFEATRMTEAQYNARYTDPETGLLYTGPYPQRGTYFLCEALSCTPGDANFDKLIAWIEQGKKNDPARNRQAIVEDLERRERYEAQQRFDRCKELLPAAGIRPANFAGNPKKNKSAPVMRSANELGLPVRGPSVKGTSECRLAPM